jgi:hypothetical protein
METKTCSTCWDYSHKFSCCFCPFNSYTGGNYLTVTRDTIACHFYRKGKNDYSDDKKVVDTVGIIP